MEPESQWIIDTNYSLNAQIALTYLLPRIKILAITLNSVGCSVKPCVIKKKLQEDLSNEGFDIPVFIGADRPYINYQEELNDDPIFDPYNYLATDYTKYQEMATQETEKEKISINNVYNSAPLKIIEYADNQNSKLNLLTLGPLTNLSLAIVIDNSIRDKFKQIFIMGGSSTNSGNSGNVAEYNFRVDPVAAKNVINYCKNITLIPVEIETQINLPELKCLQLVNQKYSTFYEILAHIADKEEETRTMYSLLGLFAAIVITNPDCSIKLSTKPVDIDINGRNTRGAMYIENYLHLVSKKLNEITIVDEVDPNKIFEAIKGLLEQ